MQLTKQEKETTINFTEADETASAYTHNSKLKRRLLELEKKIPDECYKTPGKDYDGLTYDFPKSWLRIIPPRTMSYEQKKRQLKNLSKAKD
jgi:hypothetical protein